jgi:ABC-type transport system involved in multi-copper enzyme maturation permease subunit
MLDNLKAEFRKLFSVRSTYFILAIALILETLVFWFAKGYKLDHSHVGLQVLKDPQYLSDQVIMSLNLVEFLFTIVVVLLVTHEYRYNTIMYTLASSKSRSRVLLAKFMTVTVFALVFGTIFALLAPVLTKWGLSMGHYNLVHQTFNMRSLAWRVLFVSWAWVMLSTIAALAIRSQVGAIAGVFIWSSTVENLLSLWLHNNSAYLPFSSINALSNPTPLSYMSFARAGLVATGWVILGLIVTWVLFLKRDAN